MTTALGRAQVRLALGITIASALAAFFPTAPGTTALAPPGTVFVLAGQSNMLGRGLPLSAGEPSTPSVLVWRPQHAEGWAVAADPLGNPADPANGIGPGMSFARAIVGTTGGTVGLIQCAKGGSSIFEWQPSKALYQRCLSQVQSAGVQVAAVLFLQGEADSVTKAAAAKWEAKFLKLAAAFKADFAPTLMLAEIGRLSGTAYPYQAAVRAAQWDAARRLGAPLVLTADLPMEDGNHFTVEGYKALGVRYAAAWLNLLGFRPSRFPRLL
jgi:hypothetical protein